MTEALHWRSARAFRSFCGYSVGDRRWILPLPRDIIPIRYPLPSMTGEPLRPPTVLSINLSAVMQTESFSKRTNTPSKTICGHFSSVYRHPMM